MSEICYRVWEKNRQLMLRVYEIHFSTSGQVNVVGYAEDDREDAVVLQPGEYELLRFTGLKDKNGTDVYEGDILGVTPEMQDAVGEPEVVAVVWSERHGGFTTSFGRYIWLFLTPDRPSEAEVIGNIYENPGLLEAGDVRSK